MTDNEILEFLSTHTYKPDSAVTFHRDDRYMDGYLRFQHNVDDAVRPARKTLVTSVQHIRTEMTFDELKYRIAAGWRSLEMHEVDEWLKFSGQCYTDPHPEQRRATISA